MVIRCDVSLYWLRLNIVACDADTVADIFGCNRWFYFLFSLTVYDMFRFLDDIK